MKDLMNSLFERWLEANHPYFYIVSGLALLIIYAAFALSIVALFFWAWWWKMTIASVSCFFLHRVVIKTMLSYYVDEFKNN